MRLLTTALVAAAALVSCASASIQPAALRSSHVLFNKRQSSDLQTGVSSSPDMSDQLSGPMPTNPTECFAAIDMAVQFLDQSQASSNPNRPPDFTQAEKGLTKLTMLLNACIEIINNGPTFSEQEDQAVQTSLTDMRQRIVTITDRIKAAKPMSDKYGYTSFLVKILSMLTSQMYKLEQALMSKVGAESKDKLPAILVDIVCVMSKTIEFLGSPSPVDDSFCNCFGGQQHMQWHEYPSCEGKRMPEVPMCEPMVQCDKCATTAMKWMYDHQSWNSQSGFCQGGATKPAPEYVPPQWWWNTCRQKHNAPPTIPQQPPPQTQPPQQQPPPQPQPQPQPCYGPPDECPEHHHHHHMHKPPCDQPENCPEIPAPKPPCDHPSGQCPEIPAPKPPCDHPSGQCPEIPAPKPPCDHPSGQCPEIPVPKLPCFGPPGHCPEEQPPKQPCNHPTGLCPPPETVYSTEGKPPNMSQPASIDCNHPNGCPPDNKH